MLYKVDGRQTTPEAQPGFGWKPTRGFTGTKRDGPLPGRLVERQNVILLEAQRRCIQHQVDFAWRIAKPGADRWKACRYLFRDRFRFVRRSVHQEQLADSFATDLVDIESGPPPMKRAT